MRTRLINLIKKIENWITNENLPRIIDHHLCFCKIFYRWIVTYPQKTRNYDILSVGWSRWSFGRLIGWSVYRLIGWSVGRLFGLVGLVTLVGSVDRSVTWSVRFLLRSWWTIFPAQLQGTFQWGFWQFVILAWKLIPNCRSLVHSIAQWKKGSQVDSKCAWPVGGPLFTTHTFTSTIACSITCSFAHSLDPKLEQDWRWKSTNCINAPKRGSNTNL